MQDFRIRVGDFDKVLKEALAQTYAYRDKFDNESDFKHELFHQLHGMKINGHRLGDRLPGYPTSMLHAEANPINGMRGQNSKADLIICNPTIERPYNYKTEIVVELKKALTPKELTSEIEKFSKYNGAVQNLYVASANTSKPDGVSAKRIISEQNIPDASIEVLNRNSISSISVPQSSHHENTETTLSERVTKCVKDTLQLYGDDPTERFHNFFWRNYEPETERAWTFPCEGDFTAQLYHRLRLEFGQTVDIRTEYRPLRLKRVDLFIEQQHETVGIEVKMNYDNFKRSSKRDEIESLSQKFDAMSSASANHTNFLVVIQGQLGYKGEAKRNTLHRLRQAGSDFSILYYAEHDKNAIGPVSVEEAQELSMR